MPKGRPKKEETETFEDSEDNESEPEQILPPMPAKKVTAEEELEELKAEVKKRELEMGKEKFMQTAQSRVEELEKAVHENRNHLIVFNKKMKSLEEQIRVLFTADKK